MKKLVILLATSLLFNTLQSCREDVEYVQLENNSSLESSFKGIRLKTLVIEPSVSGYDGATYTWKLGNEVVGNDKVLGFVSDKIGTYNLVLEIHTGSKIIKHETTVTIQKESETYGKYIAQVYDFLPAVGQFVNKLPLYEAGNTTSDMLGKVSTALVGENPRVISLGGYGGYVVFGFDHTIQNKSNARDFKILGNGYGGSAEPGIIMVAFDKNKNGIPDDDEWYEIAGSEYRSPRTIKNYSITYYKPDENKTPVAGSEDWQTDIEYIKWKDNQGNSGYRTKLPYHTQPYYPLWLSRTELTFTGTLLPSNYSKDETLGYYVGKQYAYGYADNGNNDTEDSNIDIDWAVDKDGNSVKLMGIDFIKVYTGTNQEIPWLGEISTEVAGAYDINL